MIVLPDRLYFSIGSLVPSGGFVFSVEHKAEFTYAPFFGDFGPPSLLMIHQFNILVDNFLKTHSELLFFSSSRQPTKLPNAILFISAFRMIRLRITPEDAIAPFAHLLPSLRSYRDASPLSQTHHLNVLTCLQSILKAQRLGWYNPLHFDTVDWAKYEAVPNGDMNWVIPGKILAFATPYNSNVIQTSWRVATPRDLVPVFRARGITAIVRLCQATYDATVFERSGFRFYEMIFDDGSNPPTPIREDFLGLCDSTAVIAVHCKAGLGRTYV
jgi:cell division cycle 14